MACAPSEDSDPPEHPPSLIRVFAVRMKKATNWAHSEDSDQTGWMPRLIWVFAGRTCHFVGFVMRRLICVLWVRHWWKLVLKFSILTSRTHAWVHAMGWGWLRPGYHEVHVSWSFRPLSREKIVETLITGIHFWLILWNIQETKFKVWHTFHNSKYGPGHAKMYLMSYANNKGADQSAHPRSLISTFVVRCSDSMICILAISKVSRFLLAPVAEQTGLNLTWSKIPEDTFSRYVAHIMGVKSPCID